MSTLLANVGMGTVIAIGLMAIGCVGWLVAVAMSMLARAPQPKAGLRRADVAAIGASIVFALTVAFAMTAATAEKETTTDEGAAKGASASRGTCASLEVGMKARDVKRIMGEPDEIRSEEDVRGPEAQAWVYQASRCSVHVLAGRVDFID